MARGGKRAQRAKNLQQGNRTSFAQSAGVSRTFQGGKGGGAWQGKGGGSKSQSVESVTTRPGSGRVTIRKTGGDNSVSGGLPGARIGPNLAARQGSSQKKVPTTPRRGAAQGRGGSTQ